MRIKPSLTESTALHRHLYDPVLLEIEGDESEIDGLPDDLPVHAQMWTNLPTLSKPSADWSEIPLSASRAVVERHFHACAIQFPTTQGRYECTARLGRGASPQIWQWLGGYGGNAVIEICPPPQSVHPLLPKPTPAILQSMVATIAFAYRCLQDHIVPSGGRFLLDQPALQTPSTQAAAKPSDAAEHAYAVALLHTVVISVQSNTPGQTASSTASLAQCLCALPYFKQASARARLVSKILGHDVAAAQALLDEVGRAPATAWLGQPPSMPLPSTPVCLSPGTPSDCGSSVDEKAFSPTPPSCGSDVTGIRADSSEDGFLSPAVSPAEPQPKPAPSRATMTPLQQALLTLARFACGSHFEANDQLQPLVLGIFINALQHLSSRHIHQSVIMHVLQTLCTTQPNSIVRVYYARALRTLFGRGMPVSHAPTGQPDLAQGVVTAIRDIIHGHLSDIALAQVKSRKRELSAVAHASGKAIAMPGPPQAPGPSSPRDGLATGGDAGTGQSAWSLLTGSGIDDDESPFMRRSGSAAILSEGGAGRQVLSPVRVGPATPQPRQPAEGHGPLERLPSWQRARLPKGVATWPRTGGLDPWERRLLDTSRSDVGFDLQVLMSYIVDLLYESLGAGDLTNATSVSSSVRKSRRGRNGRISDGDLGLTPAMDDGLSSPPIASSPRPWASASGDALGIAATNALLDATMASMEHETNVGLDIVTDLAETPMQQQHQPGTFQPIHLHGEPTCETPRLKMAAPFASPPSQGQVDVAWGVSTPAKKAAAGFGLVGPLRIGDSDPPLGVWRDVARAVSHAAVRLPSVPDAGDDVTPEYRSVLSCALQLCSASTLLRDVVLRHILRRWPTGNSDNEIALLEFIATVLATTKQRADILVLDLRRMLLQRLLKALASTHIKVARNTLLLIDPLRPLIDFLVDQPPNMRRLLAVLQGNVATHWHPLVRKTSASTHALYASQYDAMLRRVPLAVNMQALYRNSPPATGGIISHVPANLSPVTSSTSPQVSPRAGTPVRSAAVDMPAAGSRLLPVPAVSTSLQPYADKPLPLRISPAAATAGSTTVKPSPTAVSAQYTRYTPPPGAHASVFLSGGPYTSMPSPSPERPPLPHPPVSPLKQACDSKDAAPDQSPRPRLARPLSFTRRRSDSPESSSSSDSEGDGKTSTSVSRFHAGGPNIPRRKSGVTLSELLCSVATEDPSVLRTAFSPPANPPRSGGGNDLPVDVVDERLNSADPVSPVPMVKKVVTPA